MKRLILNIMFFLVIPCSLYAQNDTIQSYNIHTTQIKLLQGGTTKGKLFQIEDSSIQIAYAKNNWRLLEGNYQIKRIPYNEISTIIISRKYPVGNTLLIGLAGGITGALIYSSQGDDPLPAPGQLYFLNFTAKDKALIGGFLGFLSGTVVGIIVHSIKTKVIINGSIDFFQSNKTRMKKYAIRP